MPRGNPAEGGRPEQALDMLPEDPEECPPRPIFISRTAKKSVDKDGVEYVWLTPGMVGSRFAIERMATIPLLTAKESEAGEIEDFQIIKSVPVPAAATHVSVFLSKPPKQRTWESYEVRAFDTSPTQVPEGSVAFINLSHTTAFITNSDGSDLVAEVPVNSIKVMILKSEQVRILLFSGDQKGRSFGALNLRKRAGSRTMMVFHSLYPAENDSFVGVHRYEDPTDILSVEKRKGDRQE